MKTVVKAMVVFTIFISASLFFVSSCQKDQPVNAEKSTLENSIIQEAGSRSDLCSCPSGGCNGSAMLRLEVLDRVHGPDINVYLTWLCGPSNNQNICYSWNNPQIGAIVDIPIGYASGTGGGHPAGSFTPHYNLSTLFYFPPTPASLLKVKITGSGINQIVTFNTVLAPPPLIQSIDLYPWQWCI